jgi:hypothetical protein
LKPATIFTVASSDSSKVVVAADQVTPGSKSVSIPTGGNGGNALFYLDCLVDSGGADITISSAGFKSKTVVVKCLPQAVLVVPPDGVPFQTYVGIQPSSIGFYLVPDDPKSTTFYGPAFPRPGAQPVTVQISNSNPKVGSLSSSSFTVNGNPSQVLTFTPSATGSTELTFTAGAVPLLPSNKLDVTVGGTYAFYPLTLPGGFQTCTRLQTGSGRLSSTPATVTSHDASKLVFSLTPGTLGTASVKVAGTNQTFCLQALGSSGSVGVTVSVPGEPDATGSVKLTTPVAVLTYGQNTYQPISLNPGGSVTVGFYIAALNSQNIQLGLNLNPNRPPITFKLQSSSQGVVAISPAAITLAPGSATNPAQFELTAKSPGSTVLTLTNSAKIPNGFPAPSASVNVAKPPTSISFPDVELGKDLTALMTLTLPVPAKSDVVITFAVSDSTQALLSFDQRSPGIPQLTTIIPGGQASTQFYVYGLASSVRPKVTASVTGYGTVTANVTLDQSGFYWQQDTTTIGPQSSYIPQILAGPLDSATGLPVGSLALRPSVTGTLTVSSSNSNVVSIGSDNITPQPNAPGTATLTIHQPPGFTAPSVHQRLAVTVLPNPPPSVSVYNNVLAKNFQTQLTFNGYTGNPPLTVTSSDPSKVLLSTDTTKRGSRTVTSTNGQPVFAQTLASSGSVTIKVSSPKYPDASGTFSLIPTGLGISLDAGNNGATYQNGVYTTTTQSNAVNVIISLFVAPNFSLNATFVPGVLPFTTTLTSSNTGVAVLTGSPVTVKSPQSSYGIASATLLQVAQGQTTISISQPPGFTSVGNDQLTVQIVAPNLGCGTITTPRDTLATNQIALGPGIKPASTNLPVTVTSTDPSRVLLSPDPTTPPSASTTVTIPAGSNFASFYVHALSDNGNVPINIAAEGYTTTPGAVQLLPLAFYFPGYFNSLTNAIVQAGTQTTQVAAAALSQDGISPLPGPYTLRPGAPPIVLGVVSSDPTVVKVSPQIAIPSSLAYTPVAYTPLKAGKATLSLKVPTAYTTVPSEDHFPIVATQATITFNISPNFQLGQDLQTAVGFFPQLATSAVPVTVTSSDPTRLLVSADPTTPGQASVTLTSPGNGQSQSVYVQGLANSGNPSLTFSAPGYATAMLPVTLTPIGALFVGSEQGPQQNALTNSGPLQVGVVLEPLDPVTLQPLSGPSQSLRPGASRSVAVSTSDPKIMAVTTPTVEFTASQSNPLVGLQPVAPGIAVVSLGALQGSPLPASGNQIVFNVIEPELSLPPITVGRDLEVPVQITLGGSVPTPTSDLVINVNVQFPAQLGSNPGDPGQSSISVTIPAGQRSSKTFYVQGTYMGTTMLYYTGGSFKNYMTPVTVTNTAFVIQEAANGQALNLTTGSSSTLTVVPALSPQPAASNTGPQPFLIRAGVSPIAIAIASTNPATATTSPAQVTFNPGDQKQVFSVQAVSAGTATVKLLGINYDFGEPQASISVVVK